MLKCQKRNPHVPAMTSPKEWDLIYRIASLCDRTVVEMGPWLGRSTLMLLQGLKDRGCLHVFDKFVWEPYMNLHVGVQHKTGYNFRKDFETNVGLPRNNVIVHEGDIAFAKWTHGPIQLAFIDAYKTHHTVCNNAPEILPNIEIGGYLMDQDYYYQPISWHLTMHVLMFRLREWFQPICAVGDIALFRKEKALTRKECETALQNSMTIQLEECRAMCDYALSIRELKPSHWQ